MTQLSNIYSDVAAIFGYIDRTKTSYAVAAIISAIIYRTFSVFWVWNTYHDFKRAIMQFFEVLPIFDVSYFFI